MASAYTPPHRRNADGTENTDAARRTLSDLEAPTHIEINLEINEESPFSIEECVFDVDTTKTPPLVLYEYGSGTEGRESLLRWFKVETAKSSEDFPNGDTKALLRMPCSLSKKERADWHTSAQNLGLASASQGTGDARHLCIFTEAMASLGIGSTLKMLPVEKQKFVKKVWLICQNEGGKFWQYSQEEVAELYLSEQGLPTEIKKLLETRERAQSFSNCLRNREVEGALDMLNNDQKIAYIRDEHSGGFPLHIACFKGLTKIVARMVQIPGLLEHRDGTECTPLDIAKAKQNEEIIEILECFGARSNFNVHEHDAEWVAGRLGKEEYVSWLSEGHKNSYISGSGLNKGRGRGRGRGGSRGRARSGGFNRWGRSDRDDVTGSWKGRKLQGSWNAGDNERESGYVRGVDNLSLEDTESGVQRDRQGGRNQYGNSRWRGRGRSDEVDSWRRG